MSSSVINTWTSGPILWVEVDRPGALNAIDFEVMEALEEVNRGLASERDLRAMVLRGAGERSFISGGDLKAFAPLTGEDDARMMASRMKGILSTFEALDCWIIASIDGAAFGGGCETLLAADFRIASSDAKFGWTQTRFAVPCGWGGMTRLVERVGRARALSWLGRCVTLSADEALAAGMIDEVVSQDMLTERTEVFARELCERSREMIGALKSMSLMGRRLPREEAIEAEVEPFAKLWAGDEHHRRVDAFMARSKQPETTPKPTSPEDSKS